MKACFFWSKIWKSFKHSRAKYQCLMYSKGILNFLLGTVYEGRPPLGSEGQFWGSDEIFEGRGEGDKDDTYLLITCSSTTCSTMVITTYLFFVHHDKCIRNTFHQWGKDIQTLARDKINFRMRCCILTNLLRGLGITSICYSTLKFWQPLFGRWWKSHARGHVELLDVWRRNGCYGDSPLGRVTHPAYKAWTTISDTVINLHSTP